MAAQLEMQIPEKSAPSAEVFCLSPDKEETNSLASPGIQAFPTPNRVRKTPQDQQRIKTASQDHSSETSSDAESLTEDVTKPCCPKHMASLKYISVSFLAILLIVLFAVSKWEAGIVVLFAVSKLESLRTEEPVVIPSGFASEVEGCAGQVEGATMISTDGFASLLCDARKATEEVREAKKSYKLWLLGAAFPFAAALKLLFKQL